MSKSLRDIIPVVLEKTQEKKIPWRAVTQDLFTVEIAGGHSLAIYHDDIDINLSLRDSSNSELESVETDGEKPDIKSALRKIYELARRQALRLDDVIDEVEQTLLRM